VKNLAGDRRATRVNIMTDKQFYTYIMANKRHTTIYTGVTNDLIKRVWQHKNKLVEGFTKRYNINKLVYYEVAENPYEAIKREKEIKGWIRKKKIDLIKTKNPTFKDLSDEL